jgi:hypothetical protein
MKRLLPLALIVLVWAACAIRASRTDSVGCEVDVQCPSGVCFLGVCRPGAELLSVVRVEVQPPNNSQLGLLQVGSLNLTGSLKQNFTLAPLFGTNGTVLQAQDTGGSTPVPFASLTFVAAFPPIPDRVPQVITQTDANGKYILNIPAGVWNLEVQPQAPLPPYRPQTSFDTQSGNVDFLLPALGSLTRVQGTVASSEPVSGASVAAINASGNLLSSPAQIAADGGYTLYLPPQTSSYALEIGPPAADAGADPTLVSTFPNYSALTPAPTISIDLPPVATLSGSVSTSGGNPVAGAPVYVRSVSEPWTLARSVATAGDGTFSMDLRAGTYTVEAAPAAQQAQAISGAVGVVIPGAPVQLTCPPKIDRLGVVTLPTGKPAVGFSITATRLADSLLAARTANPAVTGATGTFSLTLDPGTYRIEVVPPSGSTWPRKVVQEAVDPDSNGASLNPITIDRPLTVVGTVSTNLGPAGVTAPVGGATVSFYAPDSSGNSVFLGSALTDGNGQYSCVLPDVAHP